MTHTPTRMPDSRRALVALFSTAAVAAAALFAQPALAMPGGHGGPALPAAMGGPGMGLPLGHPRMAEKMLDSVQATPEQRSQIRSLMEAARSDLQAQREAGRTLREQMAALFAQPTVDARAAETLRQQMLAQHDATSKRMTQLMLDVSRVLTPEQRQQLAKRMAERREMMQRHMGERRQLREHRHGQPQT